jgi:phosphocarrier protein HPr
LGFVVWVTLLGVNAPRIPVHNADTANRFAQRRSSIERQEMSSFTGEVEVLDPIGMHARPAGQIVKLVKESGLDVVFVRDGEETKANSALRLMAMKVKTGEKLTVNVHGDDAAVAQAIISQIQDFLKG